jgi:replicative DNA helicase
MSKTSERLKQVNSQEWEMALLYLAAWHQGSEVFSLVTVDDFSPGQNRELAAMMERGLVEEVLSPQWVKDETIRLGRPAANFVAQVLTMTPTASVRYYASQLRNESIRRYAVAAGTRMLDRLNANETDPLEAVSFMQEELEAMPRVETKDEDTWTIWDLMGLEEMPDNWTIPGLLRANERLVLTGSEGGGKSVFIYQTLTGAAWGVDTFQHEIYEPKRVLFLDVENNDFQQAGNLRKIVPHLQEIRPDVEPQWRSMKRRVVDLMATRDKADVIRRAVHYAPQIMYIGTAYKLAGISDDAHRSVKAIQSTVDKIREEIGCSVIIEHHAPHGFNNDRGNMRPEGSSHWMRWPDFGYGLKRIDTPTGKIVKLMNWRGDRVRGRDFPAGLREGAVLPWEAISHDEWEIMYSKYE